MGMFDKEEQTLFKPAPTRGPTSDAPAAQAYRQAAGGGDDDDERASLGEVLLFAINSARRRKLLSFIVTLICLGVTVAAVKLAPRTYVSAGEVLVSKGKEEAGGWNPDGNKREQQEWDRQILARSNIENIIKDAKLVERWDEMRPPHRRLLDSIGKYTGDRPPTDEQKFGALAGMLQGKLRLMIDQTTVTIMVEWSEPEAARDIVDSAIKRFIDKRYETEVSRTLNAIKPLEEQLESARAELERISPSTAPPKEKPTAAVPPSQLTDTRPVDPEILKRLASAKEKQAAAAAKLQDLDAQKAARVQAVQNQLTERSAVLGPAHPEIVALKLQLEQVQKDPPDLTAARAAKAAADEDVSAAAAQAGVNIPKPIYRGPLLAPAPTDKKLDDQTIAKLASARARYDQTLTELDKERRNLKTAEEDFKIKYQISHPPDVPFAPKKPVGLMVSLAGFFATVLLVLLLAALRDRSTGVMYEAKQVRDKLRLPVLGDIKEQDMG
jgi:uncharacterized protein involved in exopolysaccharide biosynthesis